MSDKDKETLVTMLSPEEMLFLDEMVEQLRGQGYEGLSREELVEIIVKATKESGTDITEMVKKLR